jgi:hypothetical protein
MTSADLEPTLRALIDARLDAIDRILATAQVAWSERRSIVGEVETQIYELLSRRTPLPLQEDVIAVLGSLDAPESYVPNELCGADGAMNAEATAGAQTTRTAARLRQMPGDVSRWIARLTPIAAGAVGLLIINGMVVSIVAASEGMIPWLVTLAVIVWLNYAAVRSLRAWSATRHGNLFDDVRNSLASWLMTKNGVQAG